MRHVLRIMCGLLIVLVVVAVGTGGAVGDALGFFFLSIICTLGISLVIWLPAFYFAGWATLGIGKAITKRLGGKVAETPLSKRAVLSGEEVALTRYIRQVEARGMSHDEITRRLRRGGWSDEMIQKVRRG